jgi:hypothetical protein
MPRCVTSQLARRLDEIGTSGHRAVLWLLAAIESLLKELGRERNHRPVEKITFMSFHVSEGGLEGLLPSPRGVHRRSRAMATSSVTSTISPLTGDSRPPPVPSKPMPERVGSANCTEV